MKGDQAISSGGSEGKILDPLIFNSLQPRGREGRVVFEVELIR